MKSRKFAILAVLALALSACGNNPASSEKETSHAPQPVSSAKESIQPTSSQPSSQTSSDAKESSKPEGTSNIDPYLVGWDGDTVDMMLKYLNQHVMPYFSLGTDLLVTWHQSSYTERDPYLLVEGDTLTSDMLTDAKSSFEKNGYIVTVSGSTMKCENQTFALRAEISQDDFGYAIMKCYWDEPFDATAASDWDKDTKDYFRDFIPGETIPYVYLGTTRITPDCSTDERQIILYGGSWKDSLIQYASAAFTAESWDYTIEDSDYSQEIKATHTSDNYSLTVSVKENYIDQAVMTILYTETFNPDNSSGEWSLTTQSYFDTYMGGHTLPYFYIGTNEPTLYRTTNPNGFEIRGSGRWDDQVITLAQQAFTSESWDVTLGQSTSFSSQTLTASGTFPDNCQVTCTVEQSRYYGVVLKVEYTEGYSMPTDITSWPSAIEKIFTQNFDGHSVPYFYIGARTPSYQYYDTQRLDIYGSGVWDDEILTNAQTALCNDQWDVSLDNAEKTVSASKNYSDSCGLQLSLSKSDYYGAIVTITYLEPFNPGTQTAWTSDVTDGCNTYLDSHVLPYIYLGTSAPTINYTEASSTMTITGGNWDSRVLTLAETAFTTDSWNITENTADKLVVYKEFTDCHRLTATVTQDSDGMAVIQVRISAAFDPSSTTSWSTEISQVFVDYFDSHALPFIYLGTDNASYYYNDSESSLTISGQTWDDSILTMAATALTSESWMVDTTISGKLTATKTYDDEHQLTLGIYCDSVGAPILILKMREIFNPSAATSWPASVQADMTSYLGGHQLPFIYLGTKNPTSKYQAYAPYYLTITGGLWDDQVLSLSKTALQGDGWTILKEDTSACILEAYQTFSEGDTIRLRVSKDYATSPKACITAYYDEAISVPESANWSPDISTCLSSHLNQNTIPYLYTGDDSNAAASYLSSWETVQIKNTSSFNSTYVTEAYSILTSDGWTCELDLMGTTIGSTLKASKELSDGSKLFLSMYGETDGTHIRVHYASPYSDTAIGSWSSSLQSEMSSDLGGYVLPYMNLGGNYLGRGEILYNYVSRSNTLEIYGGVFNDAMFEDCQSVLENDTACAWTVEPGLDESDSARGKTLTATATDSNGKTLTFRLYKKAQSYYYAYVDYPVIEITYA